MSRRTSPGFVSHRDQLAAALRDADGPVSVAGLGELFTCVSVDHCREDSPYGHEIPPSLDHYKSITCHGDYDVVVTTGFVTHGDLQRLERRGLCRRLPDPTRPNGVLWEWTGRDSRAEVDDLERMFTSEAWG